MKLLIMFLLLASCGKQTIIKEYKSADGLTSLISTSSSETCSGVNINVGIDYNYNSLLDVEEIIQTETLCNGSSGLNGTNGTDGINGVDGINGQDGIDGTDGKDGLSSIISTFKICDDDTDIYGEILLILDTGEMIGVMNDEFGARLIIIPEGVLFQSSDKNKCLFTL